jgi:hypothetical protein
MGDDRCHMQSFCDGDAQVRVAAPAIFRISLDIIGSNFVLDIRMLAQFEEMIDMSHQPIQPQHFHINSGRKHNTSDAMFPSGRFSSITLP